MDTDQPYYYEEEDYGTDRKGNPGAEEEEELYLPDDSGYRDESVKIQKELENVMTPIRRSVSRNVQETRTQRAPFRPATVRRYSPQPEEEYQPRNTPTSPRSVSKTPKTPLSENDGIVSIEANVPKSTLQKIEKDIEEYSSIKKVIQSMEKYTEDLVSSGTVPRSKRKEATPKQVTETQSRRPQSAVTQGISRTRPVTQVQSRAPSLKSTSLNTKTPTLGSPTRTPGNLAAAPTKVVTTGRRPVTYNAEMAEIAEVRMPDVCFSCGNDLKIHEPLVKRMLRHGRSWFDIFNMIVLIQALIRNGENSDILEDADFSMEVAWEYENEDLVRTLVDIIVGWMESGMSWRQVFEKFDEDYGLHQEDIDTRFHHMYCCKKDMFNAPTFYRPGHQQLPKNKLVGGEGVFDRYYGPLQETADAEHPVTEWKE